jgi:hypothetical protein
MIRRRRIQAITWLFVLAPFFGWGGGASAFSSIFATMGHSHMMLLGHEHGEVHLIFRHTGAHTHTRDAGAMSDPQTRVTSIEQDEYPDHEIHLSDYERPLTLTTKTPGSFHTSVPMAITSLPVSQVEQSSLGSVPWRPPGVNSHLRSLRAVVLLI